jgi:hypothetical protein
MRLLKLLLFCLMAGSLAAGFIACRKTDKIDTSPGLTLAFSTDTVFFDTVFATVGSVTQRLIVYNPNKNKVSIASVNLSGGESSEFRININGTPAVSANNVEIPGEDSIFVFVRVTVDPADQSIPFVVSDSLEFITNGTRQQVKLVAWGRDAIFYRKASLSGNIVWDSLKAHVIYESLRIDTNSTLTILPGTKVYFHMNADLVVSYQSSLKVPGTLQHPVRFQGDRMDPFYKDLPGQWGGIYLEQGSKDHELNYAYIKNGVFGLAADSLGPDVAPFLTISNAIIQNMTAYGIYAYGSSVAATNLVIGDCGRNCLALNYGGEYNFRYLTIGNYWSSSVRQASSVYLSNYTYDDNGNQITAPLSKAQFTNVIVYGANTDEIALDSLPGTAFEYQFDHAILKTKLPTSNQQRYISCQVNKDPVFVDAYALNYQIDSISPAIGMGKDIGIPFDIRGNSRSNTPALGAYEYVPTRR